MVRVEKYRLAACSALLVGLLALAMVTATRSAYAAAPAPGGNPAVAAVAPVAPVAPTATPAYENDQPVVQGDQVVTGRTYTLDSGQVLRGDLTVFGGYATLNEGSRVQGNVTVFGGSADINGTVTGDLTVVGGAAHLLNGARIEGKETVLGGSVTRDPGAVVSGRSTRFTGPTATTPFRGWFPFSQSSPFRIVAEMVGNVFSALAGALLLTLLAVAVAALFPANLARVAEVARQQWLVSGGVGLATLITVPIAVVVMAITVCLLPAALILLVASLLAMLGGWTVTARLLGERLAVGFKATDWSAVGQTALGAVVLAVLGALPAIGWLIGLVATALGLGALILTAAGTRPYILTPSGYTRMPSQM